MLLKTAYDHATFFLQHIQWFFTTYLIKFKFLIRIVTEGAPGWLSG